MDSPANERLAAHLREQGLRPGSRLPSERELARTLGLSHAAVNRAVLFHIGQGTLRREGYKLFVAEAGIAVPVPRFLALISEPASVQAALEAAKDCGCVLELRESSEAHHVRKALLDWDSERFDGILLGRLRCEDMLRDLVDRGVPVLVAGGGSDEHHCVRSDYPASIPLAVGHLAALGHRELAFVALPAIAPYVESRTGDFERYREVCEGLGLEESANRILICPTDSSPDAIAVWRKIVESAPQVTALVCHNPRMAGHLVELARKSGRSVPGDLSLVALVEDPSAPACDPPITVVSDQSAVVARLGVFLLRDMVRHPLHGNLRRRQDVCVAPVLVPRGSSAPLAGEGTLVSPSPRVLGGGAVVEPGPDWRKWSEDRDTRLLEVERINARPFVRNPGRREFLPLDLSKKLNRSCTREHSWLGDEPLRYLPTGELRFHGVPFLILDERANDGRSAMVLRSRKARSAAGRPLPLSVTIRVGRMVSAIYILHAAGWTTRHSSIAEYCLLYADGGEETVPVLPLGPSPIDAESTSKRHEESNIQDWHPVHPPFESAQALPCLITEGGDPLLYERYLYVWQWVNPHPERLLRAIRAQMLDPDSRATLAVLSVTAQLV